MHHTTQYQNHHAWDFSLVPSMQGGLGAGSPAEVLHGPRDIPTTEGRSWWDLSPGHVFLLQAMEQISSTRSARPPSVPLLRRSRRIMWLSEPPVKRQRLGGDAGLG